MRALERSHGQVEKMENILGGLFPVRTQEADRPVLKASSEPGLESVDSPCGKGWGSRED